MSSFLILELGSLQVLSHVCHHYSLPFVCFIGVSLSFHHLQYLHQEVIDFVKYDPNLSSLKKTCIWAVVRLGLSCGGDIVFGYVIWVVLKCVVSLPPQL
jgi:hypothetical protein